MANSNSGELKVTRQNVLTMTLRFMLYNFKNITITQLEKEYGLARKTLYRILDGKSRPRYAEKYMRIFVRLINDRRTAAQIAGKNDLVTDIDCMLRDITLAQYGVPIDEESEQIGH